MAAPVRKAVTGINRPRLDVMAAYRPAPRPPGLVYLFFRSALSCSASVNKGIDEPSDGAIRPVFT